MCGIFALVATPEARLGAQELVRLVDRLFLLSESRGKEAAGIALRRGDEVLVYKQPLAASTMIRQSAYRRLFEELPDAEGRTAPIALIGHSRLVTNGLQTFRANNQPSIRGALVGVHNGIIVNDAALWGRHPSLARHAEVDTEVFLALVEAGIASGCSIETAVARTFAEIEGTASIALLAADSGRLLTATNNGSLYFLDLESAGVRIHVSERYIAEQLCADLPSRWGATPDRIQHLAPGQGQSTELDTLALRGFSLTRDAAGALPAPEARPRSAPVARRIVDLLEAEDPDKARLRRCSRCILPETMPFIRFDEDGVCNFCQRYEPLAPLGIDALRERIEPLRRRDGQPDCLVSVSGGRDSCWGLHLLKRELGLNPIAYTYDWGLVTDLARRNQARLCGRLGIEHILVSADLRRKRENVRLNIEAWLRKPDLGVIPLFMAGDKQYFHYARKIRQQNRLELSFLCENRLERARFKAGFCGVDEGRRRAYDIGAHDKLRLFAYYGRQVLANPAYLNRSLFDSLWAYQSTYFGRHEQHLQIFDYFRWNEEEVVSGLREHYDWELATDTTSTWRIGDGTAAFYNYIYYTVAGFTENDALRSNQIREGDISREFALERVAQENRPRWESLQWYAATIGFDLHRAIQTINAMPRLYHP